jgi:hypothetical protein
VPIAADTAVVEAGLDWRITAQMKFGLGHQGELAKTAHTNMAKGNFTWNFRVAEICSPHERSDMRDIQQDPGCRYAHPGYDYFNIRVSRLVPMQRGFHTIT